MNTLYGVREHVSCNVIFVAVRAKPSRKLPWYVMRLLHFFCNTNVANTRRSGNYFFFAKFRTNLKAA